VFGASLDGKASIAVWFSSYHIIPISKRPQRATGLLLPYLI
jgi:hypothetical protein